MSLNRWAQTAQQQPSILDIAWAAGIYEGEGSCNKTQRIIVVDQKDPWLCRRLLELFGGAVYAIPKAGLNRDLHYRWVARGSRAIGFALTIFKFLSPRRQSQVSTAFNFVDT